MSDNSIVYKFDDASLYNIQNVNSSFASGSINVMFVGRNSNKTLFSKEAVEKALPSLYNVPIVCHYDMEADEAGGHDVDIVEDGVDEKGNKAYRTRNLTEPCGVIPEHATFSFQTVTGEDGAEHEYLVIDNALIWKRQEVYHYIKDTCNGKVAQSMEIEFTAKDVRKTPDGYNEICDFEFVALCLLGDGHRPCFTDSALKLYELLDFKQQMREMMEDLRSVAAAEVNTYQDNGLHNYENAEGGKQTLEFDDANKQYELENAFRDELSRALGDIERMRYSWQCWDDKRDYPRYRMVDYDKETNLVYCWDMCEVDGHEGVLFGFTFERDGDAVRIDAASKKRFKFTIVEFDGGEQPSPIGSMMRFAEDGEKRAYEAEKKCQEAMTNQENMLAEFEELKGFKAETEKAAAEKARNEVIAKFEALCGVDEFETLKTNCAEYSAADLEEKCYAILGKQRMQAKFSEAGTDNKPVKIKVNKMDNADMDEPYGGIFLKYGIGK